LNTATNQIRTDEILSEGKFYLLNDYALRDEYYKKIVDTLLDGIEALEGADCRKKVEEAGLAQIHQCFPVEKVRLLEDFLLKRMRNELYYWTFRIAREDLELKNEFFVDHLIMIRIHYPFLVAKKAKKVQQPSYPFHEKLVAGLADLMSWHMWIHHFNEFRRRKLARWLGLLNETNSYTPEAYHGNLPKPARAHAAHIDTWYGHSFDGINLWWSIAGVNEDNTVILYPEMFGKPVAYCPASMYLAEGIPLPKPLKMKMKPGQLLAFNPELLHSTHLNISNETRIAITTRLNPETPRFNVNAGFHFQHWRSSMDLEKRNFSKLSVFPASKYQGKPSIPIRTQTLIQKTIRVTSSEQLTKSEPIAVCTSDKLTQGEKMAVDLRNANVLVYRAADGLRAFSRKCPHLGTDLIDGYHDNEQIFCPGHGVAYSLTDGSSHNEAFRLRTYKAFDKDGMIYLQASDKSD